MAVQLSVARPLYLSPSPSPSLLSTKPLAASPVLRLSRLKPIDLHSISLCEPCFCTPIITTRRCSVSVKASYEVTGTGQDGGESLSEGDDDDEEDVLLDKFPLDSKLQLKLEQKMRMKFSKKIKLRRKKIVRKRRMRKKGHWPPSKVNKLSNV